MLSAEERYMLLLTQPDNEMIVQRHYLGVLGAKVQVLKLSECRAHNLLKHGIKHIEDTSGS